ncbi:MAG: hypothetical protein JXN65_03990 [Clostridia bacterium]|nr:hypothetical protein [Clostridia bacterium]
MKCPKCGTYNKPEYRKCYVCNEVLPQEYIEEKKKNNMWTQSAFREEDEVDVTNIRQDKAGRPKENGTFYDLSSMDTDEDPVLGRQYSIYAKREAAKERGIWGNEKNSRYARRGEGNIPVVALEDESDESIARKSKRGSKYGAEPLSENAKRIRYFREGQEIGIVVPAEKEKPVEPKKDNLPKKKTYKKKLSIKWGRLILISLLAVCIIFGIIIGISSLAGKVSEGMSQLFVSRNQLPNGGEPLVERVLKDGQTWHNVTFYGEDGDKILVEDESHDLKRTLTIHNNMAVLSLDDYSYIPKDGDEYYGSEFTYVDIKAWHFDKDGVETELNVPTYRISVPLAPLTIIYPVEQGTSVDTTQVKVRVKVEQASRVIIDTKNMSGNIDDEGYTSTYIFLNEGMNEIPILVEADGYRVNNYTLLIYSPPKDVDIKLIEAPTETQMSQLRIDGQTEPGATVTLDDRLPLLIDYINVDKEGRFFIKTELSDFGENEVILYVTTPDGRTATLKHIIHRLPLEGAYTSAAWVLDYKALSTAASKMIGQIYHLNGFVTERIETPEAKLFLFNTGTAADPKYVVIEYNGNYDIIIGDMIYDMYADVTGKYDNYPRLYARFIYISEDQDQNGIKDKDENIGTGNNIGDNGD